MRAPIKDQQDYAELIAYAETTREPEKWKAMLVMSFELGLRPIEIAQLDTNQIRVVNSASGRVTLRASGVGACLLGKRPLMCCSHTRRGEKG